MTHIDPVCGMTVNPDTAAGKSERGGNTYYFCSKGCKTRFDANPERYLAPGATHDPMASPIALLRPAHSPGGALPSRQMERPASAGPGGKWTCPMHPEVVRDGPGTCPICGMA